MSTTAQNYDNKFNQKSSQYSTFRSVAATWRWQIPLHPAYHQAAAFWLYFFYLGWLKKSGTFSYWVFLTCFNIYALLASLPWILQGISNLTVDLDSESQACCIELADPMSSSLEASGEWGGGLLFSSCCHILFFLFFFFFLLARGHF